MTTSASQPTLREHHPAGRWGRERGSGGTALTYVLLMPAILLLIFGGIQFGMHTYARSLALAAAQAGVRAATEAPASTSRGQAAAEDFVIHKAGGTLSAATVTVTQSGGIITVVVDAAAPTIVPLAHPRVSQQAAGTIEILP